jgi:hypothetical protein
MAVPPVVAGCILKNSPNVPQFTYDPLYIEEIGTNTLAVRETLIFRPAVPGTPSAIIGYDYDAKDMTFSKPLLIEGNAAPQNLLTVSTTATFDELRVSNLELGVLAKCGSKNEPYDFDDNIGVIQMPGQNKLFFKYTAEDYPGPPDGIGVIIQNPLLRTCSVFLKDITGVNDIPGATIQLDGLIGANPSVQVWGIPPDAEGISRGMLLFL